ncbi:Aquaporin-7 [Sphaceloma murrayae]|uniref:Aquaporin-7 n=1 Tax=Sphaceloma murrayae TaxID=2082308 RepID=A0A2K1QJS6_9PEZI|nr:Aquaporin-7 [Sphaceloma murrayae]
MAPQLYEVREPRHDWFEGNTWFDPASADPSIDPATGRQRSHMNRAGKRLSDTINGIRNRSEGARGFPPRAPDTVHLMPDYQDDFENPYLSTPTPKATMQYSSPYSTPKTVHYATPYSEPKVTTRQRSNTTESSGVKSSPHLAITRKVLGLHPTAPVTDEHDQAEHSQYFWPKVRLALREPFAEFWGTFTLVLFGDGAVAQVLLSTNQANAPGGDGFGDYQSISWGFGLGLMLGVYVAGDSGAYLNPAATFTNCLLRKLPWRRFPVYLVAQVMGAFCAAGVIYANYISAIDNYEGVGIRTAPPSTTATAGIFATYPQPFVSRANQFFSEFIASAILMFVIFALKDTSNLGTAKGDRWFPLALFFLMFGIGSCFGWQTGFAINLARDFGPRLFTYAVGYQNVWSAGNYYFWIPMVAPFFGCAFGGILYDIFIYTGVSPINEKWFGFYYLVHPRQAAQRRLNEQKQEGLV